MQVNVILKVSATDFFNEITRSILSDIQRQTNKTMHASQIKSGLKYKKKINGRSSANAEVAIKVLQCIPNKIYESSFTSAIDVTTTKYEIEELVNNEIKVIYSETYHLLNNKELKSKKIFGDAYINKKSEKRGKQLLHHIEDYILQQKENNKHNHTC